MTASQKPKTPSMMMLVKDNVSQEDIDKFCKRASRATLSQLVEKVSVEEQMKVTSVSRRTKYVVEIKFFPKKEYQEEYDVVPSEILAVFSTRFPLLLKKEMQSEMKKLNEDLKSQIRDLGKGKKKPRDGEEGGGVERDDGEEDAGEPRRKRGDDEISEVGDGDAGDEKRLRQQKEQATYESDDEEDDEEDEMVGDEKDADQMEEEEATLIEGEKLVKASGKTSLENQVKRVASLFEQNLPPATSFDFDASRCEFELEFASDMPKLLFVGIVERACRATVIREIPGIADCFQTKETVKGSSKSIIKVCQSCGTHAPTCLSQLFILHLAHHQWLQLTGNVELRRWK